MKRKTTTPAKKYNIAPAPKGVARKPDIPERIRASLVVHSD
jgi:hypothetical protein